MVAQKRRLEKIEASLPAQVLRAAELPIQRCLLTRSLFETGIGTLIVARGVTRHHVRAASFLLDVFCLGIKDVMFRSFEEDELEIYLEMADAESSMREVDPAQARKLLGDLAAWSQSIGFPPHSDFTAVERIFGEVSADAGEAEFRFGRDDKPLYIPGPYDSDLVIRRRVEQLRKLLGEGGFQLDTAA
ncbi:MAG TPA: hypothetical protein VFQ87_17795 [Bradyrhizobium sp.]|nr:hypothetical protein [Bradyrhizobium sp.]